MVLKILFTIIVIFIYTFIWTKIEKVIYGKTEPRLVDDIMMILMTPMFYFAICDILRRLSI